MHSFEDESHENASNKECTMVSIGILTLDNIDLAKKVKFSQISQRQDACGMFLLKSKSLCYFRNLYSCLKVNSFSKILGKSSVSLWITSEHSISLANLWSSIRGTVLEWSYFYRSLYQGIFDLFSRVGVGYVKSLHKFTQPFNFVFTKIVAWMPWTFVVQNDAQIKFFWKDSAHSQFVCWDFWVMHQQLSLDFSTL